jgi:hypothetical protein
MSTENLGDGVERVRSEYIELPGLSLTLTQAQRLWALDRVTCDRLLGELVRTHFLWKTESECYVRPEFRHSRIAV